MPFVFSHPYQPAPKFEKKVAYFCMEYAIHQSFKIYAGGLGYLAGSHMRSAFELKQNTVGIGILWKYGYYDQVRKSDQTMEVLFEEKIYGFLEDTGLKFRITVSGHEVWATAHYLAPQIFNTAPLFFLTTDIPENDYLARTICHRLYDANPESKIAAAILLGAGGARLLEELNWNPDIYHLNESHALPLAFHLYDKIKSLGALKSKLVFTNHTPEEGGNLKSDILFLQNMSFFCGVSLAEVRAITGTQNGNLDHTLTALRLSGKANAVSAIHFQTMSKMWSKYPGICPITYITNAQNFRYWADMEMYEALEGNDDASLKKRKQECKRQLFEEVSDQNGEIYDENILTIVFAKRFADYKRADLLLHDPGRFHKLISNKERPLQIIWAGKPYPMDYTAIGVFDKIVNLCKSYSNCSVLIGYELKLSKLLKAGADIWLNTPRLGHEASGTSGMTAAMNGTINLSGADGWFPEFAKNKINSFVIPTCDTSLPNYTQDQTDAQALYDLLEKVVIPMYYEAPRQWQGMIKAGMKDIIPQYDSNRLAAEYYEKMYL